MPNLTRAEAEQRKRLLEVASYQVDLDLTQGPEVFGSRTTVHFSCAQPGASSFVELIAKEIQTVRLGDRAIDPGSIVDGNRLRLDDLAAENVLTVAADCMYSRTGQGLHRFTDPADGAVYTYSQTFLNDAQRVFACFDQPDLKARFTVRVRVPEGWIVLSNGAGRCPAPGYWEFADTPPLATYLAAVVAGPYHSITAQHGELSLGLHCRQSLVEHLESDELFAITRQCFAFFEDIFDVPYAFGPTYDQVFVPEFNAGAMENAGCVTFRDEYLFRSQVTYATRLDRAMVIAHEMAHMWFGDLVTLRWWDDIWLNESFATYMGFLATATATRFRSAWTQFAAKEKAFGYRQDQLPTTHPVSSDVLDTESALLNFDGISYAKGASVLKQLVTWVGFDAFIAGVRDYFTRYAHSNTSLADLLAALERTSGRDLHSWSLAWLQTAGVNTLWAEVAVNSDGRYADAAIVQTAPADHPTLRSHRLAIGLYDRDGDALVRRERMELDVVGARTEVPGLVGAAAAGLLLVNDDDLTWAKLRLDERSMNTVLDGGIARLGDSLPRALLWGTAWDMARDADLMAGDYLRLVIDGVGVETDVGLVEQLLRQARRAIDLFGTPATRHGRLRTLGQHCFELLHTAVPGGDQQLAYARAYVDAVVDAADVAVVRGWLAGSGIPPSLRLDADLRWLALCRLAVLGAINEDDIAREYEHDTTSAGARSAATARPSLPTPAAKAAAWSALIESDTLSNHLVEATAAGFWHYEQVELGRPYVEPYFAAMPEIWRTRTPPIALTLTALLYPALLVEPATLEATDRALSGKDLPAGLRRGLVEQRADLARALRARERDR